MNGLDIALLALFSALSAGAHAGGTGGTAPAATPLRPAAAEVTTRADRQRITQPVTVGKPQADESVKPADLSNLVPRDSAQKPPSGAAAAQYRFDPRGVNCSLYPARCG